MGNFKKQNFDARGDVVVFGATAVRFRASQPNGLDCSEVTTKPIPTVILASLNTTVKNLPFLPSFS
jgi:hypothetical protein